jgi:hypothetical protein
LAAIEVCTAMKQLAWVVAAVIALTPTQASAQQGTVKGRGQAKITFGTPKCGTPEGMRRGQLIPECQAPTAAEIALVQRRAALNAIERMVADAGVERLQAFDRAKESILEKLDDIVLSTTELSRNVIVESRSVEVVVSVELNNTRLAVMLQGAPAGGGRASSVKDNGIGLFLLARDQASVEEFLVETRRESASTSDNQRVATSDRTGRSQSQSSSTDDQTVGRSSSEQRAAQLSVRDQSSASRQDKVSENAQVQASERGEATTDQTKNKTLDRSEALGDSSRMVVDSRRTQNSQTRATADYQGSASSNAESNRSVRTEGSRDASLSSSASVAARDSVRRVTNRSAANEYSASSTESQGETRSQSASSQSSGSNIRRADDVAYRVAPSQDLDGVIGQKMTSAGFEAYEAAFFEDDAQPPLLETVRGDFGAGDDIKTPTLRRMMASAQAQGVKYVLVGTVDNTIPDVDDVSGNKRVFAKVSAKVYDVSGRLPRTIVNVGPAQYQGLGPTNDVARVNALKNAGEVIARTVVDALNSR